MRKNQKGFSVVELLLIVVLIAIAALGGWYVAKHSKTPNSAATPSVSTPTVFAFKELRVQVMLTSNLKDLFYTKNTYSSSDSYDLNTPQFKQLAAKCGASAPTGFANIYAKVGQFTVPGKEGSNGLLKQFGSRYIAYGDTLFGNPCDSSIYSQLSDMQAKLVESLKSAFKTATET